MREQIKEHFRKHKTVYLCAGTGVIVAGITCLIMRSNTSPRISLGIPETAGLGIPETGENVVNNASKSFVGIGRSTILNNVSYINANRQGPPSWVVRCIETGEIFTSQRAAAIAMEIPENELSRHLTGTLEHVRDFHFERICMAA